ncbi:MAG: hypothetical protein ACXVCY_10730 [Pseudobdellovibrionaceae bacterium]
MGNNLKTFLHYFLFVFILAFAFTVSAKTPPIPPVKIQKIENGQATDINLNYKISPSWEKNSEGGLEFFWVLNLDIPDSAQISNIQTDQAVVEMNKNKTQPSSSNGEGVVIKMTSLKHNFVVEYSNGKNLQLSIELMIPKPIIFGEQCDQNFLKLIPKPSENKKEKITLLPGYLIYKCEKTESGVLLAVTVPNETTWAGNSIFESKGKGQRWKNFEVNPQAPSGKKDTIGEFTFENNGKHYSYVVYTEKVETKGKIARFRLSLGAASLTIQTSTTKVNTLKPAAHVSFEVRPFNPEFSIGGTGFTTIPLASSSFFAHSESIGYFGWTFGQKNRFSFEPRVYIYMGEGISQQINYFYQLNNPAFGFITHYLISKDKALDTELIVLQTAQNAVASLRMYFYKLNPININTPNWANWGIAAIFQKVDVSPDGASKDTTMQMYIGPSLDF